ncbi:MAG: cell division protein FtsQ/DivIB [Burkholderiales bacterium]|nr:cell division protein FtsQ/DivIB [Burkholderiales bacterium]
MTEALPVPFDIKIMNLTASVLFLIGTALVLAAAAWWAVRNPVFAIRAITVQGDLVHNNVVTLRANVDSRISGNFFTVDLGRTKAAFEAVPWVRRAVVRRVFPNRLQVVLQEQQPVAYWGGDNDSTLLNSYGEVFEANTGDVDQNGLPHLSGPLDQSADVLATYQTLAPMFKPLDTTLARLDLSAHGGWRAQLASGAVIELGRGSTDELTARVQRFVGTLPQLASRYGRTAAALESADLRYPDGYALKLSGVTTVVPDPGKK